MKSDNEYLDQIIATKDSGKKLRALSDFMLRVDYLSPLWYKARKESNRLLDMGITVFD